MQPLNLYTTVKKDNTGMPYSELCTLFVMHLDMLRYLHVFAGDDVLQNVEEVIKGIYVSLYKITSIWSAINRNLNLENKAQKERSFFSNREDEFLVKPEFCTKDEVGSI